MNKWENPEKAHGYGILCPFQVGKKEGAKSGNVEYRLSEERRLGKWGNQMKNKWRKMRRKDGLLNVRLFSTCFCGKIGGLQL